MTLSVHGLMKPIVMSFLVPCGHPYGTKTSQMGCALLIYHKCNQHSTRFHSSPFWDHSGPNSGMALFCWNKWSPEWQFWQDSLPKIILLDSTGMTRFWQESQGHDKDLIKGRGMFLYLAATSLKRGHSNFFLVSAAIISKGVNVFWYMLATSL